MEQDFPISKKNSVVQDYIVEKQEEKQQQVANSFSKQQQLSQNQNDTNNSYQLNQQNLDVQSNQNSKQSYEYSVQILKNADKTNNKEIIQQQPYEFEELQKYNQKCYQQHLPQSDEEDEQIQYIQKIKNNKKKNQKFKTIDAKIESQVYQNFEQSFYQNQNQLQQQNVDKGHQANSQVQTEIQKDFNCNNDQQFNYQMKTPEKKINYLKNQQNKEKQDSALSLSNQSGLKSRNEIEIEDIQATFNKRINDKSEVQQSNQQQQDEVQNKCQQLENQKENSDIKIEEDSDKKYQLQQNQNQQVQERQLFLNENQNRENSESQNQAENFQINRNDFYQQQQNLQQYQKDDKNSQILNQQQDVQQQNMYNQQQYFKNKNFNQSEGDFCKIENTENHQEQSTVYQNMSEQKSAQKQQQKQFNQKEDQTVQTQLNKNIEFLNQKENLQNKNNQTNYENNSNNNNQQLDDQRQIQNQNFKIENNFNNDKNIINSFQIEGKQLYQDLEQNILEQFGNILDILEDQKVKGIQKIISQIQSIKNEVFNFSEQIIGLNNKANLKIELLESKLKVIELESILDKPKSSKNFEISHEDKIQQKKIKKKSDQTKNIKKLKKLKLEIEKSENNVQQLQRKLKKSENNNKNVQQQLQDLQNQIGQKQMQCQQTQTDENYIFKSLVNDNSHQNSCQKMSEEKESQSLLMSDQIIKSKDKISTEKKQQQEENQESPNFSSSSQYQEISAFNPQRLQFDELNNQSKSFKNLKNQEKSQKEENLQISLKIEDSIQKQQKQFYTKLENIQNQCTVQNYDNSELESEQDQDQNQDDSASNNQNIQKQEQDQYYDDDCIENEDNGLNDNMQQNSEHNQEQQQQINAKKENKIAYKIMDQLFHDFLMKNYTQLSQDIIFYLDRQLNKQQMKQTMLKADILRYLGSYRKHQGQYQKAEDILQKAISTYTVLKDENYIGISKCLDKLSELEFEQNNNNQALIYALQALNIAQNQSFEENQHTQFELVNKNQQYISNLYYSIANLYFVQQELENSLDYYQRASQLKQQCLEEIKSKNQKTTESIDLYNRLTEEVSDWKYLFRQKYD
ncbi:hypothetical protein PPERSA_10461 [Pseudocohnilembus persalinus]|uniref:Tetratricopeptide repeat protein n=1 Tax=Pseudocohnilembus persalinus TaxID=266149 RepID=A0A0V0R0U0_PSEPJ|nr:hypothetical protein PPERSA_10461 [Pseudocohnilembus persalinus]|eukprot:KRX08099.1 hypothetical protein PPERSA_10461 [Pseudocohnilembus persalinus]